MKKFIPALALLLAACSGSENPQLTLSQLNAADFNTTVDGSDVALYTLTNDAGMEVCITNFGGRIVSIMMPDRNGELRDVVLGFDSIGSYINVPSDFGAAIGRYANRLDHGRLPINGDTIQLPTNNFGHTLHGGPQGWQYKPYKVEALTDTSIVLTLHSPDGDMNFPGNVDAKVTYTLTPDCKIDIEYEAVTDAPTVVNMTNHAYFNLNGDPNMPITNCILQINADSYTPVDSTFMTTGEIASVEGTPFDFRQPKEVGRDIEQDNQQLANANGYDHNWVLNTAGDITTPAARIYSPVTGIGVTVYTNEPGIQVYSGNFLDGTVTGKHGVNYQPRTAICLETQKYPDTPNKPQWPSAALNPGETYRSHCIFEFTTDAE